MSDTSVFENLYQEELYSIPPRTMILLNKSWDVVSEEEKNLLSKILGSVKLNAATVQIMTATDTSVTDLLNLNPSKVISFGVKVSPIQKMYENVPLDGISIIVSEPLQALDDQKKKSLWVALRQMFGI
jgi:hypothetical protein